MLAPFVNDGERMLSLEKFLKNIKRYDPNYLKFYVDVLNLKQIAMKSEAERVFTMTGGIIENHLNDKSSKQTINIDHSMH